MKGPATVTQLDSTTALFAGQAGEVDTQRAMCKRSKRRLGLSPLAALSRQLK